LRAPPALLVCKKRRRRCKCYRTGKSFHVAPKPQDNLRGTRQQEPDRTGGAYSGHAVEMRGQARREIALGCDAFSLRVETGPPQRSQNQVERVVLQE